MIFGSVGDRVRSREALFCVYFILALSLLWLARRVLTEAGGGTAAFLFFPGQDLAFTIIGVVELRKDGAAGV